MSKPDVRLTIRLPKEEFEALRDAAEREMMPMSSFVRHNLSQQTDARWRLERPKSAPKRPTFVNASVSLTKAERSGLTTEAKRQMISVTALVRRKLFQPEAA